MQDLNRRKNGASSTLRILKQCAGFLGAFYGGFSMGYHQGANETSSRFLRSTTYEADLPQEVPDAKPTTSSHEQSTTTTTKMYTEQDVNEMVQKRLDLLNKLHSKTETRAEKVKGSKLIQAKTRKLNRINNPSASTPNRLFPRDTEAFVSAMSLVDRDAFANLLDIGVPLEPSDGTNDKVLLLHAKDALPNATLHTSSGGSIQTIDNVEDAVQNCNYVSVVLTQPYRHDQCIAIMGQYSSYHVHKFMRVAEPTGQIDSTLPLKLVRRGADPNYPFSTRTPSVKQTRHYWNDTLRDYFTHLDSYLEELKPILKKAALCKTVIVMVCNQGQAELLMNFVCNAKAKGLDLSGVLIFATDPETEEMAKGLGLTTFYNEQLFRNIPQQHAKDFGDKTYAETIIAKVYSVQLVSMLGYNVLFQDVDIVWFKDPQTMIQHMVAQDNKADIYMQHDGNHAEFYAPYSGNTGFYYVRNTKETQYFLNSLLVSGDLITTTRTHQAPFLSVLSEHASLHGLRVKILAGDNFPGGMHFQYRRSYMKQFLNVTSGSDQDALPSIFHMSWSDNKDRKVEFFQQLGEFYVRDRCLVGENASGIATASVNDLSSHCCSAEPVIKCHYSDRPSKIPCLDSPKFAKGESFW